MAYLTNLALLLIKLLFFDMLLKLAFDILISPFGFKVALAEFNILTLYRNYGFAYFHILLYVYL